MLNYCFDLVIARNVNAARCVVTIATAMLQ